CCPWRAPSPRCGGRPGGREAVVLSWHLSPCVNQRFAWFRVLPGLRRNRGGFRRGEPGSIAIPAAIQARRVVARTLGAAHDLRLRPAEQRVVALVLSGLAIR